MTRANAAPALNVVADCMTTVCVTFSECNKQSSAPCVRLSGLEITLWAREPSVRGQDRAVLLNGSNPLPEVLLLNYRHSRLPVDWSLMEILMESLMRIVNKSSCDSLVVFLDTRPLTLVNNGKGFRHAKA